MGLSNSKNDSETINWNNIKTENISSTIPNFTSLSKEAKELIASLNIPEITESEVSEENINKILGTVNKGLNDQDKNKFYDILNNVSSQSENMSNTSPFITSEMYDYLVNSTTSPNKPQTGGAKNKSKKGGADLDNDSSTSTTSDSDFEDEEEKDVEDILESSEEDIKKKKTEKEKKKKEKLKEGLKDSETELSGGDLSYLSSSAHTGGEFSDSADETDSDDDNSNDNHSSIESSSVSKTTITDENGEYKNTSVSVNTEDINLVSDY
jgi:hypothetical protein